jgi:hypothetical protein
MPRRVVVLVVASTSCRAFVARDDCVVMGLHHRVFWLAAMPYSKDVSFVHAFMRSVEAAYSKRSVEVFCGGASAAMPYGGSVEAFCGGAVEMDSVSTQFLNLPARIFAIRRLSYGALLRCCGTCVTVLRGGFMVVIIDDSNNETSRTDIFLVVVVVVVGARRS